MAEQMHITPHPKKVLVKISRTQWNSLFSNKIQRSDGSIVELFHDLEAEDGYEARYQQNVSVGKIVAVGSSITGIQRGDMAIINYTVTADNKDLVGFIGEKRDRLVSIFANSTKHQDDGPEFIDGRKPWVKGDYDVFSDLIAVVRMKKIIAMRPFVILEYQEHRGLKGSAGIEETDLPFYATRKVLAAHQDSGYKEGDIVLMSEIDMFFRAIDGKTISIVLEEDILGLG